MTHATIELKLWNARRAVPKTSLKEHLAALAGSYWLWCFAAVAFLAFREVAGGTSEILKAYGDTDDATRLVQVREFLAGAGWYDLLLPRFGGATPLVSHWSRLVDLPLAMLLTVFGTVLSAEHAEIAVRAVWPSLLLLVFLRMLVSEAHQRGGAVAAVLTIAFAITTLSGVFQFRLGRIDHHNVMILFTLAGLLMLTRGFEKPALGYAAGAWIGVALTVGYEPLALVLPLIGLAALISVAHLPLLRAVRNAAVALTVTLAVGLAITTPLNLWHLAVCDALSANLVLLAATGALGLTLIDLFGRSIAKPLRIGLLVIAGSVAGGLYLAVNPVCIGGPFAEVSADARQLWLSSVAESQSLFTILGQQPTPMVVFLVFVAVGIGAALERYRRLRTIEAQAMLVLMVLAVIPALWAMKFLAYTSFIAAFCIALSVADVVGNAKLTPLSARLLGLLALNQWTISILVSQLLLMAGTSPALVEGKATVDREACSQISAVRALGTLPKGFIVAHIDLGPVIVAATHHDVLSAPYHRIDHAIAETQKIFRAEPAEAETRLRTVNASYLVDCVPVIMAGKEPLLQEGIARTSLLGRLTHGESVPFLTEIPNASPQSALRVWRINPPNSSGG